ncbi:13571_t:CDS:2, partial [Acaulospora morrowiae]
YPKSSKRKRKDKWNLVSFETPSPTARTIDRQKKLNKKTPSQAVKTPTKNLPPSASAPSIGPPSFEMTASNPTSYESLIVNTNIANDQNRSPDVNNISDNDPNIDNNNNFDISVSTFMQNDITSFQEIIRHLNRTESSDPLNRDLNNEPSFKYDNSARDAQARVNSFTTLYIPPNILNVNNNGPASNNMIHYYTPLIRNVDFTELDSTGYSLDKD